MKQCLLTLLKVLDNLLGEPQNPKFRTIRLGNKAFRSKVVAQQGVPVLQACGFALQSEATEDFLVLSPENEKKLRLVQARKAIAEALTGKLRIPRSEVPPPPPAATLLDAAAHVLMPSISSSTQPRAPSNAPSNFDVYQPSRHDGQSAAVGTNLGPPKGWKSQTETQLEALQKTQNKIMQQSNRTNPVPRNWIATLPNQQPPTQLVSTDDEQQMTSQDKELIAQHVKKQVQERQRQQAADNRGFTTKAMRDLEKLRKTKLYSHAVLAIQFPDGCILKGNFAPLTLMETVTQAVLEEALRPISSDVPILELYTTPPRTVAPKDKTLQELQFVPAVKLFVSWKLPTDQLKQQIQQSSSSSTTTELPLDNTTSPGWYLRQELFAQGTVTTPSLPQPVLLVDEHAKESSKEDEESKKATASTKTKRAKMTKEEKEAALLKRMMGGM